MNKQQSTYKHIEVLSCSHLAEQWIDVEFKIKLLDVQVGGVRLEGHVRCLDARALIMWVRERKFKKRSR